MSTLSFVFSSMNSGKTLALLTKNFMLRERGYNTLLVKPAVDNRTSTISSRIGLEEQCHVLESDALLTSDFYLPELDKLDYIFVDEAQFLSKDQVWDLSNIVDYCDVNVMCYGIKLTWQAELFEGSKELMTLADEIIQMDSYCKKTGNPALFHYKTGGSKEAVETGYEDLYETVSRLEWKEKQNRNE